MADPRPLRTDKVLKVREYQAVPSILRYVIVETSSPTVLCLHRGAGADPWTLTPLEPSDTLNLPEAGIELQVADLYVRIEFPALPELE